MNSSVYTLEQIVDALTRLPDFTIYRVNETTLQIEPFMNVSQSIVNELVIQEVNLKDQVQCISAQIQYWARLVSIARRVVVQAQRNYRVWQAGKAIQYITPPSEGGLTTHTAGWKKPTIDEKEARYRMEPEYNAMNMDIEKYEEVLSACEGILDGFRAKLQSLKLGVTRNRDEAMPTLSV